MKWGVAVLTWNDHETCIETLDALVMRLSGDYRLVVLDNGSTTPFICHESDVSRKLVNSGVNSGVDVVRVTQNDGAGAGVAHAMRALLQDRDIERVLFLEDDWRLESALSLDAITPLVESPSIGQVRLGVRDLHPPKKYWTYGFADDDAHQLAEANRTLHTYEHGQYQIVRILWSNNPFACHRRIVERFLLDGHDELSLGRAQWPSGLLTISTTPGHFRHLGSVRDRRDKKGWKK